MAADEPAALDYGIPQVRLINEQVRAGWAEHQITPSRPATDGEWCRRVFLDVLGRIPSVDELREFLASKEANKRDKLVSALLHDDKYTEEYARNMTTNWTNVLIGRSGGTERDTLTSREGLQKYLRDSFARNKPYDRMVYELVTARGVNNPGAEGFNGAVNFLTMKVNEENGALATAATSRIFLGLQVQCTQCHNHPFNDWKQQKFWEMNAFFRQTRALRSFVPGTRDVASAELVDEDFAGEGSTPEEAEIYYELRNGLQKVAYPRFIDGTELPTNSGYLSDINRREALGRMIVESDYLDRTIVNRMWAHFLGYGFTKPIDDMGPHNPPSHPVLLDQLAKDFRSNSHDLKELIRWIVLSEPYGLSSRTNSTNVTLDDPQLGETPKFSRFYLRQMRAEELYESLLVATEAHKTRGTYEEQEAAKTQWLQQFVVAFGNDEGEEATTFNGTIPQALMMFNGDLVKQATSMDKGSFLWRVANSELKPAEKINYLFLAAMSRPATKNEVDVANKLLAAREGDVVAALQDMWWAVLNSNEFIMNH
ncbi:MAG: DUF1549 domain-containing protein [Pirellulaceae bacterium]|nr:DUF1549 domain-containing protein [Pirellulaceae bacterium]